MWPKKKKVEEEITPPTTTARVVKLGGNYIVLNEYNEPLTERYPADSFHFIVDGAKAAYRLATLDGKRPSDAIIALANYVPPGRKTA
ncbi:hypothetical protein [Glutamicibacter sp. NPDC087344]|uniref:hypothetical protein n=1 Tax=Glutamicibacter sp. NPDC087344 TaxID=3363994 RepID=UPI00382E114A